MTVDGAGHLPPMLLVRADEASAECCLRRCTAVAGQTFMVSRSHLLLLYLEVDYTASQPIAQYCSIDYAMIDR